MAIMDILIGIFFVIGGGAFLFYGIRFVCQNERKKWQKKFDEIKIGDKFIQLRNHPNPFRPQYYQIVTITDKAVNSEGEMYVRYKIISDDDMPLLNDSCRIDDFIDLYHYEPYNNQDKKQ